jgi:hypothetical protein
MGFKSQEDLSKFLIGDADDLSVKYLGQRFVIRSLHLQSQPGRGSVAAMRRPVR